jgi:hypothetical protein
LGQQVSSFCGSKNTSVQWTERFCEVLEKKVKDLEDRFKNMSKSDLYDLVSKKKKVRKNSTRHELISIFLEELNNCLNQQSMYGYLLEEISPEKIYITSSGFCHDIDELVNFLISTNNKNVEPFDTGNVIPIWKDEKELKKLVESKFLDPDVKKKYHDMMTTQKNLTQEETQTYLDLVAKTAFILINDNPRSFAASGFNVAEEALGFFSEQISKLSDEKQDIVRKFNNGGMASVGSIIT